MIMLYLLGCVIAYVVGRGVARFVDDDWTKADRIRMLVLALGSFLAAMLFILIGGLTIGLSQCECEDDNSGDASW